MASMRRSATAVLLAVLLAVASGVIWFAWSVHEFGSTCGLERRGHPTGMSAVVALLLVSLPATIVARLRAWQRGSWHGATGFAVITAVLAVLAMGVAFFAFAASRHCFE
jgi:hypothetical protein